MSRSTLLVVLAGALLTESAASQMAVGVLSVVPSVGFADGLDRGLDVRLGITPRVHLSASAYYWGGLELLCGSACTPQETGWSIGLGARV
ncbi:MAG: hypothetical protein OEO79_16470 [Gemmatimonadota bacterium]|nr:hypothetical protein [Gemmatimonadota bacterium]